MSDNFVTRLLDRLFNKRVIVNCAGDPYLHRWFVFRTKRVAFYIRVCGHIQDGADNRGVPGEAAIAAQHDGGFISAFATGPKFGCIHHQPAKDPRCICRGFYLPPDCPVHGDQQQR